MSEKNFTTCMPSITLLVLKEVRLEKNFQSAYLAERVGKSPSAWAKIENGKTSFSMDSLFSASTALWVNPSSVVAAAERYSQFLGQQGWAILQGTLPAEEDTLLTEAQNYYDSAMFKQRMTPMQGNFLWNFGILNSPAFNLDGSVQVADVFRFIVDHNFRETQSRPAPF